MVIKTFKQLQDDVLNWIDEVTNEGVLRTNVKQAINAAHQRRLVQHDWSFMKWPEPVTFNTVIGQRSYALHQEFFKPIYFWNVTGQRALVEVGKNTLPQITRGRSPFDIFTDNGTAWLDATGSAEYFEFRGTSPVQRQPASASQLKLSSSSTADNAVQCTVTGETADGIEEETLVTGASGAETTGSKSFSKILTVTKVGTWAGTLTLKAGSDVLLKLFTTEYARTYRNIWLFNEPTAVETIQYDFYRQIRSLSVDNDIPQIPSPHSEILVYDALIDLAAYVPAEAASLKIWSTRQAEIEASMLDTYLAPNAFDALTAYPNYIPRD